MIWKFLKFILYSLKHLNCVVKLIFSLNIYKHWCELVEHCIFSLCRSTVDLQHASFLSCYKVNLKKNNTSKKKFHVLVPLHTKLLLIQKYIILLCLCFFLKNADSEAEICFKAKSSDKIFRKTFPFLNKKRTNRAQKTRKISSPWFFFFGP